MAGIQPCHGTFRTTLANGSCTSCGRKDIKLKKQGEQVVAALHFAPQVPDTERLPRYSRKKVTA